MFAKELFGMIEIKGLKKSFGDLHVLKGIVSPNSTQLIQVNSQVVDWTSKGVQNVDVIP